MQRKKNVYLVKILIDRLEKKEKRKWKFIIEGRKLRNMILKIPKNK